MPSMPQTKQSRADLPFLGKEGSGADPTGRSADRAGRPAGAARTVTGAHAPARAHQPARAQAPARAHAHARAKGPGTGMIAFIPYLTIVVCVIAGVYISWHQGSRGGGTGGVIAGLAFLVAAAIRLALPRKLAGFLASRSRVSDVVTLAAFGACLLVVGFLLPRLPARDGFRAGQRGWSSGQRHSRQRHSAASVTAPPVRR